MANLFKVKIGDAEIWMETEGELAGEMKTDRVSRGAHDSLAQAVMSFDRISETIKSYCTSLVETFKGLETDFAPDKITAQFGLKVSGEGNVYVVKASSEASLTITAEWEFK